MDVRLPDGTTIRNVPDGTTRAQLVEKLRANGYDVSTLEGAPQPQQGRGFLGGVGDALAGAVRGAGSIGATILAPVDAAARALGVQNDFIGRTDRREAMTGALQEMGADTDSLAFKGGQLAGEIAGTAGLPSAAARPLSGIAPRLAQAVSSGGFRTGAAPTTTLAGKAADMGVRVAGGGAAGAASAGLVNPDDVVAGGAVGAALPPALKVAGAAGGAVGRRLREAVTPTGVQASRAVAEAAGMTPAEMRAALARNSGPQLVPGDMATVPQLLQNMQVSQLARAVHNAGGMQVAEREGENALARLAALDRISPVSGTPQQAVQDFGNALEAFARPAERAADEATGAAYRAIDPLGESRIQLPIDELEAAVSKYLGPGTFGSGGAAHAGAAEARRIGTREVERVPVSYRELDNLRKSLGEAMRKAQREGSDTEAGALRTMIKAIDDRVEAVAAGDGGMNEVFDQGMVDAWKRARDLHREQKARFNTGPQAAMFRVGRDGQPVRTGGELAGMFINATRGQAEDANALLRLAQGDQGVADAARRVIATDAASTTNALGQLTGTKFNNWREARSGVLDVLLGDSDKALLGAIGGNLRRADSAQRLGMATGSNTAQNVQSALDLGLLDSTLLNMAAGGIPIVGRFTGPAINALRDSARRQRANALGELLADPEALSARLLQAEQRARLPNELMRLVELSGPAAYRAAPVLSTGQ